MVAAIVAITLYHPATDVLFCGGSVAETDMPWVAMPYSQHGIEWECGDVIAVWDGQLRTFAALDAGPFGAYCVRQADGACLPIAVDVPEQWAWFEGISTTGLVDNVGQRQREWAERQGHYGPY